MFEIGIFCVNFSRGGLLGRALADGTSRGRATHGEFVKDDPPADRTPTRPCNSPKRPMRSAPPGTPRWRAPAHAAFQQERLGVATEHDQNGISVNSCRSNRSCVARQSCAA